MLLGVRRRFVFIANPKCASTAIEAALRPLAEIETARNPEHKHLTLRATLAEFDFVFRQDEFPPASFFKFAVMRDPVDHLYSWYRYRRDNKVAAPIPKDMSFADYWAQKDWSIRRANGSKRLQSDWFRGPDGRIGLDHIIPHDRLAEHFPRIAKGLGVEVDLARANVSKAAKEEDAIDPDLRAEITAYFAKDYEIYNALDRHTAFDHPALSRGARPTPKAAPVPTPPVVESTPPKDDGPADLQDIPGRPDYLFLIIPNNSGSTVMAQYIASQARVYLPPFGNNEGQNIPEAKPLMMTAKRWSPDHAMDWPRIRAIWDSYRGDRTFLESSPPNLMRSAAIREAFGAEARFLFSICDPYQQIASSFYNYSTSTETLDSRTRRWVRKAKAIRQAMTADPRAPMLRYEDFCEDPGRLNAALGLDLVRPIRIAGKSNTQQTEIRNMAARTCSVLTAEEIDTVTDLLTPHETLLHHFGYRLWSGQALLERFADRPEDVAAGLERRKSYDRKLARRQRAASGQ